MQAAPGHGAWTSTLVILEFPLLMIARVNDPFRSGYYGWLTVLNSLVWASVIYLAVRAVRRRRAVAAVGELGVAG